MITNPEQYEGTRNVFILRLHKQNGIMIDA